MPITYMSECILFEHDKIEMVTQQGNRFLLSFRVDDEPLTLNLKEKEERLAVFSKGGISIHAVRYSKRTFVFLLRTVGGKGLTFSVCSNGIQNAQVNLNRDTDKLFTAPQTLTIESASDNANIVTLRLYDGRDIEYMLGENTFELSLKNGENKECSLGVLSVGGVEEVSRITPAEIGKAVSYYTLKNASTKPSISGIELDAGAVYTKVRACVSFDNIAGKVVYSSNQSATHEELLIDATRHILIGEGAKIDISSLVDGSELSALVSWMHFIHTRNHSALKETYLKLKVCVGENATPFTLDIMGRMATIVGEEGEYSSTNIARYLEDNVNKSVDSELQALYLYHYYKVAGDDDGLIALSKRCLKLFESNPNDTIYPLIALGCFVSVEYFMDDLSPSIYIGQALKGEIKINNLPLFNHKCVVSLGGEYSFMTVEGKKVVEIVGAKAIIRNLKNQVGGCSFFLKSKGASTISISSPIFGSKIARDRYNVPLGNGVSKVIIKNHTTKVIKL